MKVISNNPQTNPASEKAPSRNDPETPLSGELELDGVSERPSFASVLDRMTQSRHQQRSEQKGDHSKESASPQQARTKRKDEEQETGVVVASDRLTVREPLGNIDPNTDVHALLPTEDLEKIVAACRVQTVAGRPEVQLDLSHSVLDGLRVKVSLDARGGVTTEFLAANEGVKSLLDSRSAELIALLRSRGIDLVNFKSSLATTTNTGSDSGSRQDSGSKLETSKNQAVQSIESGSESDTADDIAMGATYRA